MVLGVVPIFVEENYRLLQQRSNDAGTIYENSSRHEERLVSEDSVRSESVVTWEDIKETGRIVFGIRYDDDEDRPRRAHSTVVRFPSGERVQGVQAADCLDGDAERQANADE